MNAHVFSTHEPRLSLHMPPVGSKFGVKWLMTKIASIANRDTPQDVNVPATLAGVMTWGIARLGIGAIFAGACYAMHLENQALHDRFETRMTEQIISQQRIIESYQETVKLLGNVAENQKRKP